MNETVIGVLFVAMVSICIASVLDAVKTRAENEILKKQKEVSDARNAYLEEESQRLKKRATPVHGTPPSPPPAPKRPDDFSW